MTQPASVGSYFGKQEYASSTKISFFDRAEVESHDVAEGTITDLFDVNEGLREMDLNSHLAGRIGVRVLLNQGDGGFSLVESDVAPGTRVPRHKHNLAQLALILEGSMRQGKRVLGPGSGYFTPPDQAYTFVAGPEGCRYVEFRLGAVEAITTEVVETDPARWVHES